MAVDPAPAPFVWGSGGVQMTPTEIEAQRKVAQAMMLKGSDYSPIQSPWQGVARVAQAMLGGYESGDADRASKTNSANEAALLSSILGGGSAAPATPTTPTIATDVAKPAGATAIPAGKDEFVNSIMPMAQEASLKTGVDPRVIVAQAALESGYGQHAPGNNLFGIKSHGTPGGNTLATTEVVNGQPVRTTDSFRAYASPADSVSGYADFINSNPRYAGMKNAAGLDAQVAALGKSGYATDPAYADKVGAIARGLPVPAPQVVDANAPSPLDNAAYPAGPVGAPGTQVAQAAPTPAPATAPAPAATPVAPGVNPALIRAMSSPYVSDGTKKILGLVLSQQMEAAKNAADPLRQLQIQQAQKTLGKSDAPTSVQEYEYYKAHLPAGQEPMPYDTWSTAKARAGATTVNNNIGGGSDKQIFDTFAENTKEARAAATGLVALRNARQALQGPGGAITGFGADERLTLQKLGAAVGVTDPSAIQNTETFRAAIAPQVAAMLKSTVGTNQISNSDREFAEKAAGGSIKLDAGSINRLLGIMEGAGTARLKLHQQQLDSVYPDPEKNKRERALFSVTVPDAPTTQQPTATQQPAIPQPGAIQGGYRFRGGDPSKRENWEPVT